MNFAPYSFSKLQCFEMCPRRFKFTYIDKIKPQTIPEALTKGRKFHEILENYTKHQEYKDKYPEEYEKVQNFVKSKVSEQYLDAINEKIKVLKEHAIGLDNNLNPCKYSDKKCLFRGKFDLATIIGNTLNIIDYKTGANKSEVYQDYRQLMFYALYFFKKSANIDKIKISYIYVYHNNENSMVLERKYIKNYEYALKEMISKVESATEFPKCMKLCSWCPYNHECEKYGE